MHNTTMKRIPKIAKRKAEDYFEIVVYDTE